MKIGLIARGCKPGSGIELYTFELARRLAQRHDVSVITRVEEFEACGAKLIPVNVPGKPLWYSILRFSTIAGQLAKKEKFDIVHTQGSDAVWGDVVTAHSCHSAGMRASLKNDPTPVNQLKKIFSPAHRGVLSMERKALTSAQRIVTVSRGVARQIRAAYPAISSTPIQVVYPGVSSTEKSDQEILEMRKRLRQELGIDEKVVLFTLVANDPVLKGAGKLIAALSRCRQKESGLLIVSAQCEHQLLKKQVKDAGLNHRVFLKAMPGDATAAFCACDIYAGFPEYESFGLTFLEALSFGKPVMVSNNAGITELVQGSDAVSVLPVFSSIEKIATVMDQMIAETENHQRLAEAARTIADKYNWDNMVEALETVYAQVRAQKQDK